MKLYLPCEQLRLQPKGHAGDPVGATTPGTSVGAPCTSPPSDVSCPLLGLKHSRCTGAAKIWGQQPVGACPPEARAKMARELPPSIPDFIPPAFRSVHKKYVPCPWEGQTRQIGRTQCFFVCTQCFIWTQNSDACQIQEARRPRTPRLYLAGQALLLSRTRRQVLVRMQGILFGF